MLQHRLHIVLSIISLMTALLFVQPVLAGGAGFLSGSVFIDSNGNARPEPGEATLPGATVHVRSQLNPMLVITAQADHGGYFALPGVPYGTYDVWVSVAGKGGSNLLTVEVAEVNAQVSLDIPVHAGTLGSALAPGKGLFLPLITSAR